jgi:uncharacterized membrane protein
MDTRIREFALLALFIALVAVCTMIVRIPIPQTSGYLNLGDSIVLLGALFFGPVAGFISGGIGSALADIWGYPQWAPWTLAIKGIESLIVFGLASVLNLKRDWTALSTSLTGARSGMGSFLTYAKDPNTWKFAACFCIATSWMVLGYYLAENIMYDQKAALAEVPMNVLQAIGSVMLATLLLPVFSRIISSTRNGA